MIHYGSRRGVFGSGTEEAVDLNQADAFQITMSVRSRALLSDRYDFNLVYYRRDLSESLWNAKLRKKHLSLKQITRRVAFGEDPSVEPLRVKHFYLKSDRPVYVAKMEHGMPNDDCVPLDYVSQFNKLFVGYLMRCPKAYPLEVELFGQQGLSLAMRRDGAVISSVAPHVLVYQRGGLEQAPESSEVEESVMDHGRIQALPKTT
ncbi:hypothetical protein HW115_02970 [Verrucomicrobiaceae bacterium N1E253]|uniref:Uncharacterized protein n=1 Tax=Oceaniferula marina TaxID=2748318 RepID=A0A851GHF4_9BACT|nr:hypothetical protein [Oceaniferula marina]NWK54557.1 hypothetical protein [Oceaniferula marina]